MKKLNFVALAALSLTLLFTACSVEKRHYTKGYNVNWNKTAPKADIQTANHTAKPAANQHIATPQAVNAIAQHITVVSAVNETTVATSTNTTETTPVAASAAPAAKKAGSHAPAKIKTPKMTLKKPAKAASPTGSGKSQLVALLLCIFLGYIGIHRFYLGYTTIGILQIITLGGCGVWALIDLIRIITGDLGPKDGDYTETL